MASSSGQNAWSHDFSQIGNNKMSPAFQQLKWDHKMATSNKGTASSDSSMGIGMPWTGHFCGANAATGVSYFIFGQGLWTPQEKDCKMGCETFPMCSCNPRNVFVKQETVGKGRIRLTVQPTTSVVQEAVQSKSAIKNQQQQICNYANGENRFYPHQLLNPMPSSPTQYEIMTDYFVEKRSKEKQNAVVSHKGHYLEDDVQYDWSEWAESNQWSQNQFFIGDNN